MKLRFACPECHAIIRTDQVDAASWTCRKCGFIVPAADAGHGADLAGCRVCGNHELYVQKAFPHWLGMGIVVLASLGFMLFHATYWFYAAWGCLVGAFFLDVLLYSLMGNVTVCYRCQAFHCGFAPNPTHQSFELTIAERYRQERLRKQQMGPSR